MTQHKQQQLGNELSLVSERMDQGWQGQEGELRGPECWDRGMIVMKVKRQQLINYLSISQVSSRFTMCNEELLNIFSFIPEPANDEFDDQGETKKIGAKKQKKLEEKAMKKAMREV